MLRLSTIFLVIGFIVSFFLGLLYGDVTIPISEVLHPNGVYGYILSNIRLPTLTAAILIGIILSTSGAVLQMLLRNPLVDPYISGTASGGAFGAVLTYFLLMFNLPFSWIIYFQPLVAFFTATLATLITIMIGKKSGYLGLVIGGVLVSFIFSSLVTIILSIMTAKYPQIPPLTFWLLGDISIVGWFDVMILSIFAILLLYFSLSNSRLIDLLSISDEISYSQGVNPNKQRVFWLLFISLVVAYCVSIAGIIGFLGIIVPHIIRRLIGGNTRQLVTYSSLLGSTILILSDILSHGIFGYFIPLTALLSIVGAPIMIFALVRRNVSVEEY
ncbi:iron ABC transporter permease [Saccharolobus solfataricus]|uniref:Iron ABC transporter permease n=2 Tax=Saccharolobus solfataricus TaxID=2287 RepID=A0A0E3GWJ3_SACSO|nr:iron ABC transporter permease [Saccharolobus solfataricus]AKA73781.1 iron ABC transporter permease [Saccharolobus solfataricus]AKA76478.1 iron ABC transporter permease [Saccharolobus solfataricus]AKA79171.1 iron ABC transporter permease [Saccharolobus solfataricus]AZF68256.1 iron ABC transporter permease [Saccharolobus solfataricus]AZF70876.1 iron ABC transporter permease [Saccharolobus solfataricus]